MHPAPRPVQRRAFSVASALMVFGMCLTLFSPLGVPLARAVANGEAASLVLGQPDFTTNTVLIAFAAAGSMQSPVAVAVDLTTGKVFVADKDNNRVLRFASAASMANGSDAEGVFGQADFTGRRMNRGGTTAAANTLSEPQKVTVDSTGTLWVADNSNNRVLSFANAGGRTAVNSTGDLGSANSVLGQVDFTSSFPNRGSLPADNTLSGPYGVAVDPTTGAIFVADYWNHRVLRFASATSLNADGVIGQADFASRQLNRTTTANANTLNYPSGVAVSSDGTLWVADTDNNRVLRFASAGNLVANGTGDLGNADNVLGQTDFTSNLFNRGGTTADANTLSGPVGMAVGSDGTLWVADTNNHRVLRFTGAAGPSNGANADGVLGQADFTSNLRNRNDSLAATANTLNTPFGMTVDSNGIPWVAEWGNNRVLGYASADATLSSLTLSEGPLTPSFVATTTDYTATVPYTVTSLTVTPTVSDTTATVTVRDTPVTSGSASGITLTVGVNVIPVVVTAQNSTITKTYTITVTRTFTGGQAAILVLGQPDFVTTTAAVTDTGMSGPLGVAVDPTTGKVFVTDSKNNRVLRFASLTKLSNGVAADGVIGQADFTSNGVNRNTTLNANTLSRPYGVTVDITGTLWIADNSNHRVLRFANAASKLAGANADSVLGQADFTSNASNRGGTTANANTLYWPFGVAMGSDGTLWVSDASNHRVLRFANAGNLIANGTGDLGNADSVLGQANFTGRLANRDGSATATANTLANPYEVAVGNDGTLWVVDANNHRVLRFTSAAGLSNGKSADGVLGQANLTSNESNRGMTAAANTLTFPRAVAVDPTTGGVFVADGGNNRVLGYNTSTKANLRTLVLSSGTLTPAFATATTDYTATVPYTVTSLTVTPTVSDTNATVTVNGTPVTSGSASGNLALSVGANAIRVVVTAADGTITKTYTISVIRAGYVNVWLGQTHTLVTKTTPTVQSNSLAAISNTLTLTITVNNTGSDAVTGIVVMDTFPAAAVGTVWTWTCVGAGGGVCGNASGTGNLNETLGLLPKDGKVTFGVTGSLLNPNNWRNTPGLIVPSGVTNAGSTNPPVTVGNSMIFIPLVVK